ncbi:TetR family transcriptional regulator C-terminal domain-containing protein [Geopsychrobacter electrodiphilus]|uniref:TetR family transcriptional regulator C-terminal domain-containing protein n=1 Tax=Geopsychrobacter electrodiphilus TaxID=225196 RepID=UPI0003690C14|nr:TetR family transcriptional regulator C-terminal domain-containing protein [Geopsychrobacter electrodiphilus]
MENNQAKSPQKKRSSLSRKKHEARILKAAEEVFAQFGFNGATIDTIAKRAGLSKQNMLYYFASKQLLYQKVLEDILGLWLDSMALLDQPGQDPASKLESYIRKKIELSRTRPNGSKVFATEIINGASHLSAEIRAKLLSRFEEDVRLVESWITAGKMDQIDPQHLFFMIWSTTQTYADFSAQIELILGKKKLTLPDFEDAAKFITQVILKGTGLKC